MNSRLPLYVSLLFVSALASSQYMRREAINDKEHDKDEADVPLLETEEYNSLFERSKAGEQLSVSQKLAMRHKSMVEYRNSLGTVVGLLAEANENDKYDEHGFLIFHHTIEDAKKEIAEAEAKQVEAERKMKDDQEASLAESKPQFKANGITFANSHERAEWFKAHTANGMKDYDHGFWAEERPDEERLDPETMKVYTWRTYQKRFPYMHSVQKEVAWKKLPLAPKKVHKVKKQPSHETSATLLEDGSTGTLVDEQGKELVWTRDNNGYYHWGTKVPTAEEIFEIAHPYQAAKLNKRALLEQEAKRFELFFNASAEIENVREAIKSSEMIKRLDAIHRLESVRHGVEETFNLTRSKEGKAHVSVRGAEGTVLNFDGKIEKLTVRKIKDRIENTTGIPWEAQKLFIHGQQMKDEDLLNEYLAEHQGSWIDLVQDKEQVLKDALQKRGLDKIQSTEEQSKKAKLIAEANLPKLPPVGAKSPKAPKVFKRQDQPKVSAEKKASLMQKAEHRDRKALDRRHEQEKAEKYKAMKEQQRRTDYITVGQRVQVPKPKEEKKPASLAQNAKVVQKSDKKVSTKEDDEDKDYSALYQDDEVEREDTQPRHGVRMMGKPTGEGHNKLWEEGHTSEDVQDTYSPAEKHSVHYTVYTKGKDHLWHVSKETTTDHRMTPQEQARFDAPPSVGQDLMDRLAAAPADLLQVETPTPHNGIPAFIQLSSSSSSSPAEKASDAAESKEKVHYVLDKKSMPMLQANADRVLAARKWREAANPVEEYTGKKDPDSLTELSKRRTEKEQAYDGMQAVSSGFWAEDRPNERRVDLSDHKVYTWKQYRLKHSYEHSWKAEEMWKKLPTEQRVKKLGAKAFVQRFR